MDQLPVSITYRLRTKGDVVCQLYGDRQVPIMHVDQNIRAEHSKGRHGHVTPDCRVQRRRKGPKVTSSLDGLKLRAFVVIFFPLGLLLAGSKP